MIIDLELSWKVQQKSSALPGQCLVANTSKLHFWVEKHEIRETRSW